MLWRLMAVLCSLLMASAAVILSWVYAPRAVASYPGWTQGEDGSWTDRACKGEHDYDYVLFKDPGLSGSGVRICHPAMDLCQVPFEPDGMLTDLCTDYLPNAWANDKASSLWVAKVPEEFVILCLFPDAGFRGRGWRIDLKRTPLPWAGDLPEMVQDALSSIAAGPSAAGGASCAADPELPRLPVDATIAPG